MRVPFLDLTRQSNELREAVDAAIREVVQSGRFILGPYVSAFEDQVAAYCGVKHAIGVASGTDALWLSLRALGVGPGDRVLVPSFTFFATVSAVCNAGATPVFCDVDPKTFNLDPESVSEVLSDPAIASQVKGMIPVHLFGQCADMDELAGISDDLGIPLIEDAAQAFGASYKGERAGSLGRIGCFSFYPTKNLGAYGDGGMITTHDDALADKIRQLRVHGAESKYFHDMIGTNSRLDAIQAAALSVKLKYVDKWNARRAGIAARYDEALADLDGLVVPTRASDRIHTFHQYTLRVPRGGRDGLQRRLKEDGVGTMIYYPRPLHLQEAFKHLGHDTGGLRQAERASEEVLSLPIFPELSDEEIAHVTRSLRARVHPDLRREE